MSFSNRFADRHPFDFIPPRFFWPLLVLTFLLIGVFGITSTPLTTEAAPYGVVSFELAGTVEKARNILSSWDHNAALRAAFGLGMDFLFIAVYASTIALGCGMASQSLQRSGWPLARWGNLLSWSMLLAALLDVIENIALTTMIFGSVASPWPEIARACAVVKFALVFIGIVYALYGAVVRLVERIAPPEQA